MIQSPARFVIAVGSGKGGVGKSTVSLNLALALLKSGAAVGVYDADMHGPDIPLMVGLKRETWTKWWELGRRGRQRELAPIERYGLRIVSAGFILAEDQPMVPAAMTLRMMALQLLTQVNWGKLDFLIIDLPPGTADIQQELSKSVKLAGAIVVVTPQDVAHLDARKAVRMFELSSVKVLGGVENMAWIKCPHCGNVLDVFARVSEERSIWAAGVHRLVQIPLDPSVSEAGDMGRPLLIAKPTSIASLAFEELATKLKSELEPNGDASESSGG
jgi:ATP-binding protein involved in chromosome partitioning